MPLGCIRRNSASTAPEASRHRYRLRYYPPAKSPVGVGTAGDVSSRDTPQSDPDRNPIAEIVHRRLRYRRSRPSVLQQSNVEEFQTRHVASFGDKGSIDARKTPTPIPGHDRTKPDSPSAETQSEAWRAAGTLPRSPRSLENPAVPNRPMPAPAVINKASASRIAIAASIIGLFIHPSFEDISR